MSWEALAWAANQKPGRASDKLVLLALADRWNDEKRRCWPSHKWLQEFTDLNSKTIITCLQRLEQSGMIADTGERAGKTRQVKVYALSFQAGETLPETEHFQKRNTPVFSNKDTQKRVTEPSREPLKPSSIARALPDDWEPVLTPAAQRIVDGWPPDMFEKQLQAFRDHAADKGRKSKDWQAAFRTWITKAEEWRPRNGKRASSERPVIAEAGDLVDQYYAGKGDSTAH